VNGGVFGERQGRIPGERARRTGRDYSAALVEEDAQAALAAVGVVVAAEAAVFAGLDPRIAFFFVCGCEKKTRGMSARR
jgi:hypothetical protein